MPSDKQIAEIQANHDMRIGHYSILDESEQQMVDEMEVLFAAIARQPEQGAKVSDFQDELQELINRHSQENGSDTPDYILAAYLNDCLKAFNSAVQTREAWYGRLTSEGSSDAK